MRFSCDKNLADIDLVSSGVDPVLHLPVNASSLSPICKALDLTASSKKYLTCYLLVKCTFPEIVLPSEMWFLTMYTPTAEKLQYVKQIPPWSSVADHWWAPLPGVKMPALGVWWNHPNLPPPIWLKHSSIFHTDHHHHLYTFHERTSVQTVNSSWNFPFKVVEYLMNVSEE